MYMNFIHTTRKQTSTFLQTLREPPTLPMRVYYRNREYVRKDVLKMSAPWTIKENTSATVQVGMTSDSDHTWKIVVNLTAENAMQADVKVRTHGCG